MHKVLTRSNQVRMTCPPSVAKIRTWALSICQSWVAPPEQLLWMLWVLDLLLLPCFRVTDLWPG